MVGTTVSGATVGCPACGAALRLAFADGGSAVPCHRCGEPVRVPRRPHPVETGPDGRPAFPAATAGTAARGVRLLQVSLALSFVEFAVLAVAFAVWVSAAGPAGVVNRRPADLGPLLATAAGLSLGLSVARAAARWVGYRRLRAVAAQTDADRWLTAAFWAVPLKLVGWAGVLVPWAVGVPFAALPAGAAVLPVAWAAGGLLEFAALVVWQKVFTVLADGYAASRVGRYAVFLLGSVAVTAAGLTLVQMTAVTAARRADPLARPRVNWADLPADATPAILGLLLVTAGLVGVLGSQYGGLLSALRARLRGA